MKLATNINEQISILKNRGMCIENEEKAREILLDIGYYRLGFYWFPLEKTYPNKKNRNHEFVEGASFKWATNLYYFDCRIRSILIPYLSRIEVNLRTFVIYTVSNHYRYNPTWFADRNAMKPEFITSLPDTYSKIRNNEAIKRHHDKYQNDIYAPAWKTLEYMTFGDLLILLKNLKDNSILMQIANHYGLKNISVFFSYMDTIRIVRNLCAHGHNIYDLKLQKSIKGGPIGEQMKPEMHHNLCGVLLVIFYLMCHVSNNRLDELRKQLLTEFERPETVSIGETITYIKAVL